jgi:formamidopyrimidine-DNA glycosylase
LTAGESAAAAPRGMMRPEPELPGVEAVRRRVESAMGGAWITHVLLRARVCAVRFHQPLPRDSKVAGSAQSNRHDHVVFTLSNGVRVTFNDPRRCGVMDVLGDGPIASDQAFAAMGPKPLESSFGGAA